MDLLILLGAAVASALYALLLNWLHPRYAPDWVWLTVVGGNALIGLFFALFCWIGAIPWRAFGLLVALNVAAGIPIIVWQIGLSRARALMRWPQRGPSA